MKRTPTSRTKSRKATGKGRKVQRLPPGTPNPVDVHVGSRVRLRRTLLGLSQEKLGETVGLTFQQIQKYERGANRIGASRLYEFSQILDVPVSFFFDDLPDELKTHEGRFARGMADKEQASFEPDPLARRETLELVRAYYKINEPSIRKKLFDLTKSLGVGDLPED
ncbi:MAG: helix-turn-helix domain-containing protein [Rhodobacterales bacterium]|nr:helix-turn-helix domain-containing protein [Rhodobacterales bacterium]